MKYLRIVLTAGLGLIFSLPVNAQDGHKHQGKNHEHTEINASAVYHEESLYHSDTEWTSHRAEKIRLKDFQGNPLVIVMFYGNCTDVCPILIQDAWRLYSNLDSQGKERVNVLAVSFDHKKDTPEVLLGYANREQLNIPGWHFLSGERSEIRELAMLLGVEYRERSDGMFDHSNLITVLDEEGRIAERIEGLGQPTDRAVSLIHNLIQNHK